MSGGVVIILDLSTYLHVYANSSCFLVLKIIEGFLPYFWRGSHLDHVAMTIWSTFRFQILRNYHMKFEFNWPSGFKRDLAA